MNQKPCFFCGGRYCKYDNWALWTGNPAKPNAFDGVYSSWITEDILAMARPSTRRIQEYKILDKFREAGIGSIFNLQEVGEHASCGDGNEPDSGFSYKPEIFMDPPFHFYGFGWKDMDVPTLPHMLSLVQVMSHALSLGQKIAVHCHAGLGRTGLAIACCLVYHKKMTPDQAIQQVRANRPGSLQTNSQKAFVQKFEAFVSGNHIIFTCVPALGEMSRSKYPPITLAEHMSRQQLSLHGDEQRQLRHVPKIVYKATTRLAALFGMEIVGVQNQESALATLEGFGGFTDLDNSMLSLMESVNQDSWSAIDDAMDPSLLVQVLLYWLLSLKDPLVDETLINLGDIAGSIEALSSPVIRIMSRVLGIFRDFPHIKSKVGHSHMETIWTVLTRHRSHFRFPFPSILELTSKASAANKAGKSAAASPTKRRRSSGLDKAVLLWHIFNTQEGDLVSPLEPSPHSFSLELASPSVPRPDSQGDSANPSDGVNPNIKSGSLFKDPEGADPSTAHNGHEQPQESAR